MLKFFGISLPVVQVSGGLALAAMGWKLLNQEEPDEKEKLPDMDGPGMRSLEQKVFYPFTFPITAGPGCIVVMVTLSAHASGKAFLPSVIAHAGIVIAVVLLSVAVYFCYGHAPTITAYLSTDRSRHPSSYRVRVAVHRRTDYVERGRSHRESDVLENVAPAKSR